MPEEKSDRFLGFEDVVAQLRATNAMLAAMLMQGKKRQLDLITMLSHAGLVAGEIAKIVGTTTNTVQVTLSRSKKRTSPVIRGPNRQETNNGRTEPL